jgi:hypothetical protein
MRAVHNNQGLWPRNTGDRQMAKKGSYKVAGRFVTDSDVVFRSSTHGVTVWRRGDVGVARLGNGTEGRAQFSDHGAGRKSVQVFDDHGGLLIDVDTSF